MTNPSPYSIGTPDLHDAAASAVNTRLTAGGLTWLSTAYGAVQKMTKEIEGRVYDYPGIYTGGSGAGDYLNLLPDEHLISSGGGYSYFEFPDVQRLTDWKDGGVLETDFSLVFWFDFRRVYPNDWQDKTVSNVIRQVLDELAKGTGQTAIDTDIEFSYSSERIYQGYSHKEIDRQFLMKPYGGFRIDGELFYHRPCA